MTAGGRGAPTRAATRALTACSNGVDDDEDGRADSPLDPGCATASGMDEAEPRPRPQCADGRDNDENGRTDFPDDVGCAFAADPEEDGEGEPPPRCEDERDDDLDGLVDLLDPGCVAPTDDREEDPATPPASADGVDNDDDGAIDFPADADCTGAGALCEVPGAALCGGVCIPVETDPSNCGDCGRQRLAGLSCVAGACVSVQWSGCSTERRAAVAFPRRAGEGGRRLRCHDGAPLCDKMQQTGRPLPMGRPCGVGTAVAIPHHRCRTGGLNMNAGTTRRRGAPRRPTPDHVRG